MRRTKKGFTLIELLAVIVILAIIALIAVPIILNMIENAKKSAAVDSTYGYIDAIEKNNTLASMDSTKYTKIEDNENIDINDINVSLKGTAPTSGTITIVKGNVKNAEICINGYQVKYENNEATVESKCDSGIEEGTSALKNNDSLLGKIAKKTLSNNTYETIEINDETYTAHVYNYNGNQTWTSDMTFGDSNDVATADEDAKNMVIVKVDGDLTINEGVTVTTYASADGYGGPKGFLLYVTGTLTNNGTISMTARGAKAEGQNVYLYKNSNGQYEFVPKKGANGGLGNSVSTTSSTKVKKGNDGEDGLDRATGGGGAGSAYVYASGSSVGGNGSAGTSYSGGSGGGATASRKYNLTGQDGQENGQSGGNGTVQVSGGSDPFLAGGGAGNPGGVSNQARGSYTFPSENGTGGLLIIYTDKFVNNGNINSNGSKGGYILPSGLSVAGGGNSGAGSINIFCNDCNKIGNIKAESPSVEASDDNELDRIGGAGGNGSITIGSISSGTFVKY